MDIEIYIFYGAVFVVIFSELPFALAKELGDSKNFCVFFDSRSICLDIQSKDSFAKEIVQN